MAKQQGSASLIIILVLLLGLMTIGYFYYENYTQKKVLDTQLSTTKRKLRMTQKKLREKESALNEQASKLYSLDKQRNTLREEISNIKKQLDQSKKAKQNNLQVLEETAEGLKEKLEEKEGTTEGLKARLKEKETLYENVNSQLATQEKHYKEKLTALNDLSASLNEKYQTTKQQLNNELKRIKTYSSTIETLEQRLTREKKALTLLQTQLQTMDEANKQLNSEKSLLIKQMEDGITIIRLNNSILFPTGEATLNTSGKKALNLIAKTLASFPKHLISIEGHTDNRPIKSSSLAKKYPSNWELSSARATVAIRYLTQAGLPPTQFQAIGFGSTRPISHDSSREGRKKNRRIEILLYPPTEKNIVSPPQALPANQLSVK